MKRRVTRHGRAIKRPRRKPSKSSSAPPATRHRRSPDGSRQLVPKASTLAMLVNPIGPNIEAERMDVQAAAVSIGLQLLVLDVDTESNIEVAFARMTERGVSRKKWPNMSGVGCRAGLH